MLCIRCVLIITSCCSTGSERPHRCCHLANNGGSRRIFSILHDGPGPVPQDWPFPWAGLSPTTWFLGPTRVHTPNGISIDWFSTAYGYVQQTHTQTDHGTSITIAPPGRHDKTASLHVVHTTRPNNNIRQKFTAAVDQPTNKYAMSSSSVWVQFYVPLDTK